MNALRPTLLKPAKQHFQKRFASGAYKPKTIDFTNWEKKTHNVKKDWFSDPSTYPLIVIMGTAITFMTGAGIHALVRYKDVQIDPAKRNSKLQNWGSEEYDSTLSKVISWNAYGKEGLGVSHEEWLKRKEAERRV
ncbi:hypothetical protein ACHAWO_004624 [Cyclotella atomus]|jgi:hypothetical protein|uniref:Uncharacterized protein n=1 Tax=Cyclotella atomus TaxID=382360 RepID=A0ABD3PMS4_9STRA